MSHSLFVVAWRALLRYCRGWELRVGGEGVVGGQHLGFLPMSVHLSVSLSRQEQRVSGTLALGTQVSPGGRMALQGWG